MGIFKENWYLLFFCSSKIHSKFRKLTHWQQLLRVLQFLQYVSHTIIRCKILIIISKESLLDQLLYLQSWSVHDRHNIFAQTGWFCMPIACLFLQMIKQNLVASQRLKTGLPWTGKIQITFPQQGKIREFQNLWQSRNFKNVFFLNVTRKINIFYDLAWHCIEIGVSIALESAILIEKNQHFPKRECSHSHQHQFTPLGINVDYNA